MIMYRNNIPLVPAEELGYHLGLTVPVEDKELFYDVRTSDTPPSTAGYGTQILKPDYEPNKVFAELGIPLSFKLKLAGEFDSETSLMAELQDIEAADADALLCFNHGVMRGEYQPNSGHVTVFDRIIDGRIRMVDASWKQSKWRLVEPSLLFDAIQRHGSHNSGGVWRFKRIKVS